MRNDKESLMGIIAGYDIIITIKRIIVGLITKTSPRGFKIFKEFSWTETLKTGFFKNVTCFTDLTVFQTNLCFCCTCWSLLYSSTCTWDLKLHV